MMESLLIYFLPTIIALGIITSYEDVKEGKIRNKYLIASLIIGLITYLILILSNILVWKDLKINILYALTTLALGFILWYFGWWNSGDSKLITVFAFLIPHNTYAYITTQLPFLDIAFNALIPIFIYLVITLIIKAKKKDQIRAIKDTLKPWNVLQAIIVIFSISWLSIYIFQWTGIKPNIILNLVLIAIVFRALKILFKEQTIAFLGIISILRIFLNKNYFTTKMFMISFLVMIIVYILIFGYIRRLSESYTKKINIYQLQEGMVLAEGILKTGFSVPLKTYSAKDYICTKTTPLIHEDIQKIQKLHKEKKLHFNKIKINSTIIFAPHIFLGTMITIVCKGNMIIFIKSAFGL